MHLDVYVKLKILSKILSLNFCTSDMKRILIAFEKDFEKVSSKKFGFFKQNEPRDCFLYSPKIIELFQPIIVSNPTKLSILEVLLSMVYFDDFIDSKSVWNLEN